MKASIKWILAGCVLAAGLAIGYRLVPRRNAEAVSEAKPVRDTAHVTFNRHVAPILFENCAECHRPGQSGPFSLTTYEEVRKRGRQIVEVTQSGFMPPWLPAQDHIDFLNERHLTDEELSVLQAWVDTGMEEGDPEDLPALPNWTEGWRLGDPDLTVRMDEPYELSLEGGDVYRNFVIPIPVEEPRWVRTVEIRPGSPKVVHHAVAMIDRTPASRELDRQSEEIGFGGGMSAGQAHLPDGHFIGWAPGKMPSPGFENLAWRLDPGTDFVLQLHMRPSGKPEAIQPILGLYYAEQPPAMRPYALVLRNKRIDIPPTEPEYRVQESLALPVDVLVFGIYPHAHYLCKEMKAYAELPDGSEQPLLWIPRWDFNWQDEYRYAEPFVLPAGTTVHMDYTYDNTSANPMNPNHPPRRVVYGQNTTDEMAELMLQVLPRNPEDWMILSEHVRSLELTKDARLKEERMALDPGDVELRLELAERYLSLNRHQDAADQYRAVIEASDPPTDAVTRAHLELGKLLMTANQVEKGIAYFYKAVRLNAASYEAHYRLADAAASAGFYDAAMEHFPVALRLSPDAPECLNAYARALSTHPDAAQRDPAKAVEMARRAVESTGEAHPGYLDTLAIALAASGEFEKAVEEEAKALEIAESNSMDQAAARIRERLELFRAGKPYR